MARTGKKSPKSFPALLVPDSPLTRGGSLVPISSTVRSALSFSDTLERFVDNIKAYQRIVATSASGDSELLLRSEIRRTFRELAVALSSLAAVAPTQNQATLYRAAAAVAERIAFRQPEAGEWTH
ncbi:MAG: hypothetical protein JOZ54_07510 [Acidobacteria bacterium]|nr:hypothetical protein [Acidobacteriota bacterium]